eukprot:GHVN01021273.1.p1 GENE.GHVN01021273.1~~GHVN01021273.1.p1  ORF type:complete len:1053 (-),score=98.46 GHVN01021273.1:5123-8281(-)
MNAYQSLLKKDFFSGPPPKKIHGQESQSIDQTSHLTSELQTNHVDGASSELSFSDFALSDMSEPENALPDEKKTISFYLIDIQEIRGEVCLFGISLDNPNNGQSVCVRIQDTRRSVFFVPADSNINTEELQKEVIQLASCHQIRDFTTEMVLRRLLFKDERYPGETKCVRISYPFRERPLPDNPGKAYSMVCGLRETSVERLIVECEIQGPCWLEIDNIQMVGKRLSFCPVEGIAAQKSIIKKQSPPPKLSVLSLGLETDFQGNERTLLSACGRFYRSIDIETHSKPEFIGEFLFTRKNDIGDVKSNQKKTVENEKELLVSLCKHIWSVDPDVVVSHGLIDDHAPLLIQRLAAMRVPEDLNPGRLCIPSRRTTPKSLFCGRLICDLHLFAKEHTRIQAPTMQSLANAYLKPHATGKRHPCSEEAETALLLMEKMLVLPLTRQLTVLSGNLWARTLSGSRSNRIEFLLLHEFHRAKTIFHEKKRDNMPHKKYAGGLVLEPKKGFYDTVTALLDFNSLYPSIIQEYDICFTTFTPQETKSPELLCPQKKQTGILPRILKKLVDRRKEVKRILSSPGISEEERLHLDIRQRAIKLTANSVYGCLGFSAARFNAQHLAELVTALGRRTLENAVKTVEEKLGQTVIYGDTDSLVVDTRTESVEDARRMAENIKREINKTHSLLEIDIESLFRRLILFQKKKYCALVIREPENEIDVRGLEVVRRDWCSVAKNASKYVIEQLLKVEDRKKAEDNVRRHLEELSDSVRAGSLPLDDFAITKTLLKQPEEYPDKKAQPHVMAALRMRGQGGVVFPGLAISYVVCRRVGGNDLSGLHISDRAIPVDEAKRTLAEPDAEWYLKRQVYSAIARLCLHTKTLSPKIVAKTLGMKDFFEERGLGEEIPEHFVGKHKVVCPRCKAKTAWEDLFCQENNSHCIECKTVLSEEELEDALHTSLRKDIIRLYSGTLTCLGCGNQTRLFLREQPCTECGGSLAEAFSSEAHYKGLLYLKNLFYSARTDENVDTVKKTHPISSALLEAVERYLSYSEYPWIDCDAAFSFCH